MKKVMRRLLVVIISLLIVPIVFMIYLATFIDWILVKITGGVDIKILEVVALGGFELILKLVSISYILKRSSLRRYVLHGIVIIENNLEERRDM